MSRSNPLRIALAQYDFLVGDVRGNLDKALRLIAEARDADADLLLFPEMTLSGYPPEDLLLRPGFLESCHAAVDELSAAVHGIDVVFGHPWAEGERRYNTASWIRNGRVLGRYFKKHLPNYLVFDEHRYFDEGGEPLVVEVGGVNVGVIICEDAWESDPAMAAKAAGAELLIGGDSGGQEHGHFYAPAVVTGAPAETALLREETFGPVAPIVPVKDLDEAIEAFHLLAECEGIVPALESAHAVAYAARVAASMTKIRRPVTNRVAS